jgi:hypothetical protein
MRGAAVRSVEERWRTGRSSSVMCAVSLRARTPDAGQRDQRWPWTHESPLASLWNARQLLPTQDGVFSRMILRFYVYCIQVEVFRSVSSCTIQQ